MGRKVKGFGNNDYRFYKTRQKVSDGEIRSDEWDEVKNFNTEEDAHTYWDTTDYKEMHKVELIDGERWVTPFILTDHLYQDSDIRMGM